MCYKVVEGNPTKYCRIQQYLPLLSNDNSHRQPSTFTLELILKYYVVSELYANTTSNIRRDL